MEEWMDGMRKKGDLAEICLDKINLGGERWGLHRTPE